MRILGIDPGLATIGVGLVTATTAHDIHAEDWLTIRTSAVHLADRLREIHEDLLHYIREAKPDLAVVEKLFFARNETSAIHVAHARGCILMALASCGVPCIEPTPLQLKSCITGDGRASKQQVQDMLVRMLQLPSAPEPDDAADALALAVFGALHRDRFLVTTP